MATALSRPLTDDAGSWSMAGGCSQCSQPAAHGLDKTRAPRPMVPHEGHTTVPELFREGVSCRCSACHETETNVVTQRHFCPVRARALDPQNEK